MYLRRVDFKGVTGLQGSRRLRLSGFSGLRKVPYHPISSPNSGLGFGVWGFGKVFGPSSPSDTQHEPNETPSTWGGLVFGVLFGFGLGIWAVSLLGSFL